MVSYCLDLTNSCIIFIFRLVFYARNSLSVTNGVGFSLTVELALLLEMAVYNYFVVVFISEIYETSHNSVHHRMVDMFDFSFDNLFI